MGVIYKPEGGLDASLTFAEDETYHNYVEMLWSKGRLWYYAVQPL